ncbi:PQQ-binding-like beta-propeller repeat protein [Mycobacterium sp. DL99]|uniref:outer membrane protein assembly factor BamB family protein n=1 Tax=Mycobacterium sp. DL99 TaxID=2528957 RepID=UPI001081836C|nr:PQQ-binding-like beta-propeller repeat protein [Mycobacterium sp. DL99]
MSVTGAATTAVRWSVSGVATIFLLVSIGLGAFTASAAGRPACAGKRCSELVTTATSLAWSVTVTAIVAVAAVAGVAIAGERARPALRRTVRIAVLIAAAGLVTFYLGSKFTDKRNALNGLIPPSQQIGLVPATVLIGVAGLLALSVVTITPPPRPDRRAAMAGIAVGVIAAVALTLTQAAPTFSKESDAGFLSATTAPAADIPPFPAKLGQQRFTMAGPRPIDTPQFMPRAAGPGFVMLRKLASTGDKPAVVAYDPDGRELWRYSRIGPMPIADLRVYGGGAVVIADASTREAKLLIGLDAATGAPIWTSDDRALYSVFRDNQQQSSPSWSSQTPLLVDRGQSQWIAYDPHTGHQRWTVSNPLRCADGRTPDYSDYDYARGPFGGGSLGGRNIEYIDTTDRLITILDCSTPDRFDLREISIDTKTGALQTDRPVPATIDNGPRRQLPHDWSASPAGAGGYNVELFWRDAPEVVQELFVNAAGAPTLVYQGPNDWMNLRMVITGPDGGFVAYDNNRVRQFSGSGDPLCEFALPEFGPLRHIEAIAVLRQEITYVLDDTHMADPILRVVNRSDCRETATVPVPVRGGQLGLYPVRGSTIAVHSQGQGNSFAPIEETLIGYS